MMKMKLSSSLLTAGMLMLLGREARAQATQAPIFVAEIESFTLDPACADDFCSATLVAGGETVIIPANVLIDLPANRMSAKQIFDQSPAACVDANGVRQSGLASSDVCAGGRGGFVTLAANRTRCGNVIAGDVYIRKGLEALSGDVTYINYEEGWFRIDGVTGDRFKGTMVRFNDPSATHSIQVGTGCNGGPNCSPDPRFTNDPVNYTTSILSGYPICIPSTIAPVDPVTGLFTTPRVTAADPITGAGDAFCPQANRPAGADPLAADSRRFAPLKLGDNVFVAGNFETISGARFLSANTVQVNAALLTADAPDQPDYVQIVESVWDMPSYGRNRVRFRILGQGTLPALGKGNVFIGNDLDIYASRVDPRDGAGHLDPIASTFNNPGTKGLGVRPTGVNIWRIDYDVTFPNLGVKPNQPCTNLLNSNLLTGGAANKCPNGGTLQENFSVLSPLSREVVARTRHKQNAIDQGRVPVTLNIMGAPANQGEFLRPLGISLGGIEPPSGIEFDLNYTSQPYTFEGLPWLLDRRLSPTGCPLGGCEPVGPIPIGTLGAFPFPFSGRDPDVIVSPLVVPGMRVPVPGRPTTYFEFDPLNQTFATGLVPLPVDTECAPGTPRRGSVPSANGEDTSPSSGGCAVTTTGSSWSGDAVFAFSAVGLVLAGRRARRARRAA